MPLDLYQPLYRPNNGPVLSSELAPYTSGYIEHLPGNKEEPQLRALLHSPRSGSTEFENVEYHDGDPPLIFGREENVFTANVVAPHGRRFKDGRRGFTPSGFSRPIQLLEPCLYRHGSSGIPVHHTTDESIAADLYALAIREHATTRSKLCIEQILCGNLGIRSTYFDEDVRPPFHFRCVCPSPSDAHTRSTRKSRQDLHSIRATTATASPLRPSPC